VTVIKVTESSSSPRSQKMKRIPDQSIQSTVHRTIASQTSSELALSNVSGRQQPAAALPQENSRAGAVAAATYREVHEGATAAMASQTPSELAISNVRWRQQPAAAQKQATSGAGAVAAETYTEVHEGATAAMAGQTPSELAISSVRWRQQPSAAPRASKASGGNVCSLSTRPLPGQELR
jgi:predicted transcriptional regulator